MLWAFLKVCTLGHMVPDSELQNCGGEDPSNPKESPSHMVASVASGQTLQGS